MRSSSVGILRQSVRGLLGLIVGQALPHQARRGLLRRTTANRKPKHTLPNFYRADELPAAMWRVRASRPLMPIAKAATQKGISERRMNQARPMRFSTAPGGV